MMIDPIAELYFQIEDFNGKLDRFISAQQQIN